MKKFKKAKLAKSLFTLALAGVISTTGIINNTINVKAAIGHVNFADDKDYWPFLRYQANRPNSMQALCRASDGTFYAIKVNGSPITGDNNTTKPAYTVADLYRIVNGKSYLMYTYSNLNHANDMVCVGDYLYVATKGSNSFVRINRHTGCHETLTCKVDTGKKANTFGAITNANTAFGAIAYCNQTGKFIVREVSRPWYYHVGVFKNNKFHREYTFKLDKDDIGYDLGNDSKYGRQSIDFLNGKLYLAMAERKNGDYINGSSIFCYNIGSLNTLQNRLKSNNTSKASPNRLDYFYVNNTDYSKFEIEGLVMISGSEYYYTANCSQTSRNNKGDDMFIHVY